MIYRNLCEESSITKQSLEDDLNSALSKAYAISTYVLDENFKDYPDLVRHGCLWAISDYIEASIKAYEELQNYILN